MKIPFWLENQTTLHDSTVLSEEIDPNFCKYDLILFSEDNSVYKLKISEILKFETIVLPTVSESDYSSYSWKRYFNSQNKSLLNFNIKDISSHYNFSEFLKKNIYGVSFEFSDGRKTIIHFLKLNSEVI